MLKKNKSIVFKIAALALMIYPMIEPIRIKLITAGEPKMPEEV